MGAMPNQLPAINEASFSWQKGSHSVVRPSKKHCGGFWPQINLKTKGVTR
jgi:hypothetical protein